MKRSKYTINYTIHLPNGRVEEHTTKVGNCMSKLHAKVELNAYIKKKYPNLISVEMDDPIDDSLGFIGDFFSKNIFNDVSQT